VTKPRQLAYSLTFDVQTRGRELHWNRRERRISSKMT